jgi:hypothetical protein
MKVLFYDVVQESDAPASLKSCALADRFAYSGPVTVKFDFPRYIDAAGIGFTDAKQVRLTWTLFDGYILNNMSAATPASEFAVSVFGGSPHDKPDDFLYEFLPDIPSFAMRNEIVVNCDGSGLYEIPPVIASAVTIECNGSYIGRFGAGKAVSLATSLAKEPSFNTTEENIKTLSGQIIPRFGGYNFRSVGLDTRYKIGGDAMREIKAAYPKQIAKGFPFFLLFDSEARRLPFYRLYAKDGSTDKFGFESGVHDRYLFSRKFEFEECF